MSSFSPKNTRQSRRISPERYPATSKRMASLPQIPPPPRRAASPRSASAAPLVPPRRTRNPTTAYTSSHRLPSGGVPGAALPPFPPQAFPLYANEDSTDCESETTDNEEDNSSFRRRSAIRSFLGVRTSIISASRDLEEAGASNNSSSATIAVDDEEVHKDIRPRKQLPETDLFESHGLDDSPLPPKKGPRIYRYLRWNFGSVYRRIFALVYIGNLAALAVLVARHAKSGEPFTYQQASIAVTANILASVLVRNEHVVNAMFWVFGTWTKRLPLGLRILAAKVYSYGGIHSGGAVSATVWYMAFLVLLTMDFQAGGSLSVIRSYIYFVSYSILFLLVTMLISAHPHLRRVMHNWFEGIHRFMGWLAVLLFWAQVVLLAADATQGGAGARSPPLGKVLLVSPNLWMLVVITLLVIYPWTRLRLREVDAEVLSEHCVKLNFKYRRVHYGQAIRLTDAPLKETHAFGVIPFPAGPATPPPETAHHCPGCMCNMNANSNEKQPPTDDALSLADLQALARSSSSPTTTSPSPPSLSHAAGSRGGGFSVLVSNAGDWTRKLIQQPPTRIYTRGAPQFGVVRVAGLFAPCVLVATGSGIAPCLGLFAARHPVRVVWSAKAPLWTYGRAVVEMVYRADPDAVVIDTSVGTVGGGSNKASRRPDLVRIAYRVWEQGREVEEEGKARRRNLKAEAVVVISNQKVTRKVVYGLESRGVPAYGAIFDS